MRTKRRGTVVAAAGIIAMLALTACGSDSDSDSASMPDESMAPTAMMTSGEFGDGCAAVPKTGDGSFVGMSAAPVATAASNNPLLSTLVDAVGAADLVSTLNGAEALTVFAPVNDAFDKIPERDLSAVLADKDQLTSVLTYHVVEGQLTPDELAGELETLQGDTVTVEGSGEDFTVNGASVICGNVKTANATVYIIDGVLMPMS